MYSMQLPTFDDDNEMAEYEAVEGSPADPSNQVSSVNADNLYQTVPGKFRACSHNYRPLLPAERIEYESDMRKLKEQLEVGLSLLEFVTISKRF